MLTIKYSSSFKKDVKLLIKRGWNINFMEEVIYTLRNKIKLPERYRDHQLAGEFKNYRDCHIKGDWVLIYRVLEDEGVLQLVRTGTHDDLGID